MECCTEGKMPAGLVINRLVKRLGIGIHQQPATSFLRGNREFIACHLGP